MKKLMVLLIAVSMALGVLTAYASADEMRLFSDVTEDDWFAYGVKDAAARGLMIGTGGDKFSPSAEVNRAMVVTVLWRIEGEPEVLLAPSFNDVPDGEWYTKAVAWAAAMGIAQGRGDGSFAPLEGVTREAFATFLYRWAQGRGYDVSADTKRFTGYMGSAPSDWAEPAMDWARDRGFFNWKETRVGPLASAQSLCVDETATRAETAVFLSRFCRCYIDETESEEPKVLYRMVDDNRDDGGYLWDFMTMELPEFWMGSCITSLTGYEGINAVSVDFQDCSNKRPRSSMGKLFELILCPEGTNTEQFGSWEKLGDAEPGKSGRICTVDAGPEMGRINLYVKYFADSEGMWAEEGMRIYDPEKPANYLKMSACFEQIINSIRFDKGVAVVDAAPSYAGLMKNQ